MPKKNKEPTDKAQCREDARGPDQLSDVELREKYPLSWMLFSGLRNRDCPSKKKDRCEIAPAWKGSAKFRDFLFELGPRGKSEITLDRIDPTIKRYGPGLCRWATKTEQTRNRTNTVTLTSVSGVTRPLVEWSELLGVPESTMRRRQKLGWPDDCVIRNVAPENGYSSIRPKHWPAIREKEYQNYLETLKSSEKPLGPSAWLERKAKGWLYKKPSSGELLEKLLHEQSDNDMDRYIERDYVEQVAKYHAQVLRNESICPNLGWLPERQTKDQVREKINYYWEDFEARC